MELSKKQIRALEEYMRDLVRLTVSVRVYKVEDPQEDPFLSDGMYWKVEFIVALTPSIFRSYYVSIFFSDYEVVQSRGYPKKLLALRIIEHFPDVQKMILRDRAEVVE